MGDSFAAGEGSPNLTGDKWNNPHPACHNSDENGRSAAARRIQTALGENYRGPTSLPPPAPAPLAHQSLLKSPRSANGYELNLLVISVGLDFLAGAYTTIKARIDADLKPKAVAVVGVPNPVRDQDNRYCHRFEDGVGILPSNLLDPSPTPSSKWSASRPSAPSAPSKLIVANPNGSKPPSSTP